jgi:hypothetical protein
MPLRIFKCPLCGYERETLRNRTPKCNHNQDEEGSPVPLTDMEEVLTAPNQKFMISADPEHGKSKIKDQDKMLKSRSRNHSRDVLIDENIQINKLNGLDDQVSKSFLNTKGERRRKIDDI